MIVCGELKSGVLKFIILFRTLNKPNRIQSVSMISRSIHLLKPQEYQDKHITVANEPGVNEIIDPLRRKFWCFHRETYDTIIGL